jgi:hypothetical protein
LGNDRDAGIRGPIRTTRTNIQTPQSEDSESKPEDNQLHQQERGGRVYYKKQIKQKWETIAAFVETKDKLVAGVSAIFIAAFTVILAVATGFLYYATRDLVKGAEEASARELRAYSWIDVSARLYPGPPEKSNRYAMSLTIVNSGKSWARNLQIRMKRVENPSGDPFDVAALEKTKTARMVLGPGQQYDLQFEDVWLTELPDIKSGARKIFYVAWITYEDALSDPPVLRQTQLSRQLAADLEGIGHVAFSWMDTHNCADDDCGSAKHQP